MTRGEVVNPPGNPTFQESPGSISEVLLGQLDDELRTFAVLRMFGNKNRQTAEPLGCTERRVERKLARVRDTSETAFPR